MKAVQADLPHPAFPLWPPSPDGIDALSADAFAEMTEADIEALGALVLYEEVLASGETPSWGQPWREVAAELGLRYGRPPGAPGPRP